MARWLTSGLHRLYIATALAAAGAAKPLPALGLTGRGRDRGVGARAITGLYSPDRGSYGARDEASPVIAARRGRAGVRR
ncbi:MAG: hypothetical protein KC464_20520, partial [Myxococcales bacterium]|nr:hypothetical protein [Myxococcales bacterium]